MSTEISRGEGKLYDGRGGEPLTSVSYQVYEELTEGGNHERWWGELTLTDYIRIPDGDRYLLELEDKRTGRCSLNRRINRAVSQLPPRYVYLFQGSGSLE